MGDEGKKVEITQTLEDVDRFGRVVTTEDGTLAEAVSKKTGEAIRWKFDNRGNVLVDEKISAEKQG